MTNPLTKGLRPIHPGEILREDVLPTLGRPKAEIARLLGISRNTLDGILNEKRPVTAHVALRFGKMFGNGPEIWLNLQARYDFNLARKDLGETLEAIPRLEAA